MTGTPADTEQEASRLKTELGHVVESHGLILEEVCLRSSGSQQLVQVIVDFPTGTDSVGLDLLGEVTNAVSAALDADRKYANSAPYELEVSSPGLSRPLTQPRHFARNVGRLVKLKLNDGTKLHGRITAADAEEIQFAEHHEAAKKGMKTKVDDPRGIALNTIGKAVVDVEFNFNDAPVTELDAEDLEA